MRFLLAIIIPGLAFFSINRPIAAVFALILQFTFFCWLIATLWALYSVSEYNTDKRLREFGIIR